MMKKLFVLAAAVTLSTNVFAGNMSENNDMKAMHSKMQDKQSFENILKNEDMQRLHEDMTINAMSEVGMEARLKMISTEEGRSYHNALKKWQKNTAG
ncbi:MAG TPA: hypothetical protein VIN33_13180 [Marinobacter sp.]